jgi:adenosine deaminase
MDNKKSRKIHYFLPKAEMHVHISLALSNDMFVRRVKKRRTPLELEFLVEREKRYYNTLIDFHHTYEQCRDMTDSVAELASTVQGYLERIAREGAIYAEISNSYRAGDTFKAQLQAIQAGIEAARANTGIEARIVVTCLRDHGADFAMKAVKDLQKLDNPYVTAFGLVGDESANCLSTYRDVFHEAWDGGLGLAPHVAEQHLDNAVNFLQAVPKAAFDISPQDSRRLRVGHGVLIHTSSDLITEFAEKKICMEMCISANKRIGLPDETKHLKNNDKITSSDGSYSIVIDRPLRLYYETTEAHPIADFMGAGIPICLGSDNPLLMNTNIGKEYSMAWKAGITEPKDSLTLTRNAIAYANIDPITRNRLMKHVNDYAQALDKGVQPEATALGYSRAALAE